MGKLYLDTHIFADYWFDRHDIRRPLGEFAHRLLQDAVSCKHLILISPDTLEELRAVGLPDNHIQQLLSPLQEKQKLVRVTASALPEAEARQLGSTRRIPYADALHAVLARDNGAVLVTRDHHHERVTDIASIAKPEELL